MEKTSKLASLTIVMASVCALAQDVAAPIVPATPARFVVERIANHRFPSSWGSGQGVIHSEGRVQRVQFKYEGCQPFSRTDSYGYPAKLDGTALIHIQTFPHGSKVPDHCALQITRAM